MLLEIKNLHAGIDGKTILKGLNLQINKGEFVYLIGKTGSGKSSLLKLLYGELLPSEGQASIAGYDLNNLKRKDIPYLRRKLGIVFQDFQLLPDRSINENLLFVMKATGWTDKAKMQSRIQELLDKVKIGAKGTKNPYELSGGEQQRVAIARALINDPEVILADEPTGNLDPETSLEILQLLSDISQSGRAVLMASHDINIMNRFKTRTLKCEMGRVMDI